VLFRSCLFICRDDEWMRGERKNETFIDSCGWRGDIGGGKMMDDRGGGVLKDVGGGRKS